MRTTVLVKIGGEDRLSLIFDKYMGKLFSVDIMSFPMDGMKTTMSSYDENKVHNAMLHYELTALCRSLHSIRDSIISAINLINVYEKEYDFDWKLYATNNRIDSIREYGSDNERDYKPDGSISFSDSEEDLSNHTFRNELSNYFDNQFFRGECIGSSTIEDYYFFSGVIRNATDINIFKFFSETNGTEMPIYRKNEDGEMVAVSTADRIESEINEDIQNANVVTAFEMIINDCTNALNMFKDIHNFKNEKEKYIELRKSLTEILNVDYRS